MPKKNVKNQRRKPTQARALAKYQRILDAAPQVLMNRGYQKATTEEIALEAEVSIGTLYEYFENKDTIFGTYLNQQVHKIMAEVAKQINEHNEESAGETEISVQLLVKKMIFLGVTFIFEHQKIFGTIVREIPGLWEIDFVKALDRQIIEMAKSLMLNMPAAEDSNKTTDIDEGEFEATVIFLTNTIIGLYIRIALTGSQHFSPEQLTENIMDLVSAFIKSRLGIELLNAQ